MSACENHASSPARGLKINSLADARSIVLDSFEVQRYEPQQTNEWDTAYTRYRELLRRQAAP